MEVRSGYKQTDLGVVPDDWHVCELDKVTQLQVGYAFKSEWFGRYGELRLLRGENVGYGSVDWSDTRTLDISKRTEFSHYLLSSGDIIIGMDRTFTKSGVKISRLTNKDISSLLVQRVGRFIPTRCNADFLWHVLSFSRFHAALKLEQTGMDIPHLSRMEILHPIIAVPPLPEQQAIADALSDIDQLIASLDRLIAKKRDMKQASMQQLLTGKTRLKGFSGEWEMKRLGDIAHLYQPQTIGQSVFTSEGYPVYGANGIIGRYSRYNHTTRQITISCRGNCGTVNMTEPLSWITGNAMVVNLDHTKSIDWDFAYHLLMFQDFSILVTGSGQPQIVRGPLKEFAIIVPKDVDEQVAISAVLSDMDTEIMELEKQRDKTTALKQGMMQELLTGRTRLI